jgi:hypothetical protein
MRESARRSLAMAQAKGAEILELTRSRMLQEKEEALRELQERVEKDLRGQWDESLRTAMDNAEKVRVYIHTYLYIHIYPFELSSLVEAGVWHIRLPLRLYPAVSCGRRWPRR